jgi:hypothetical protein
VHKLEGRNPTEMWCNGHIQQARATDITNGHQTETCHAKRTHATDLDGAGHSAVEEYNHLVPAHVLIAVEIEELEERGGCKRSRGVEEWRSGGVEEWRSGGEEEWRSGGVGERRRGVEEWRSG